MIIFLIWLLLILLSFVINYGPMVVIGKRQREQQGISSVIRKQQRTEANRFINQQKPSVDEFVKQLQGSCIALFAFMMGTLGGTLATNSLKQLSTQIFLILALAVLVNFHPLVPLSATSIG